MFIKLELSLFFHSSNNLYYNSKKDANISLREGTQQLEHEAYHLASSRAEAKNVWLPYDSKVQTGQPDFPVCGPDTCMQIDL